MATKYSESDYVASILRAYDTATDAQVADGVEWYPSMYRIVREHAATTEYSVAQVAGVYAATSINTPWARNHELAARALQDGSLTSGTLTMVCDKVNAVLAASDDAAVYDALTPAKGGRYKVRNFAANMSGDYDAVTVDRWAHRVATDGKESSVPTGARYVALAAAYRIAASMRGVTPATMQAVTWVIARGSAV